ncbi:TPA: hypothetical protein ACG5ZH_003745, partial [Escherichia coli]
NNYHLQQESNLIYYGACYYVPAQVRRLPSFHTEASSNENQKYSRYLPCDIILQLPGIKILAQCATRTNESTNCGRK